jgi:serine protease Do
MVGINTAIFSPSGGSVGIGFAIRADTAQTVIAALKDKGVVARGWTGVQIQPVTQEVADSLLSSRRLSRILRQARPESKRATSSSESTASGC